MEESEVSNPKVLRDHGLFGTSLGSSSIHLRNTSVKSPPIGSSEPFKRLTSKARDKKT